jgi:hypothetical protein
MRVTVPICLPAILDVAVCRPRTPIGLRCRPARSNQACGRGDSLPDILAGEGRD